MSPTAEIAAPERTEGTKYQATRGLDYTQIAKLIREDIKALRKSAQGPVGTVPAGVTIGVKQPHPGSIKISVTDIPQAWGWHRGTDRCGEERWLATEDLLEFGRALRALAEAYNYNASDAAGDYTHKRFYLSVTAAAPESKYADHSIDR